MSSHNTNIRALEKQVNKKYEELHKQREGSLILCNLCINKLEIRDGPYHRCTVSDSFEGTVNI